MSADQKGQDLSEISVVLCRVQDPGNVGSACRAMKAMGVGRLILADCPPYDEGKLAALAVHALDVYERAIRLPSLKEALAELNLAAGFTRRGGKARTAACLGLEDFALSLGASPGRKVGLVFGNERTGLSEDELDLCNLSVHIPTSPSCPSLNVAQAVQIACYELSRRFSRDFESIGDSGPRADELPSRAEVEAKIGEAAARLGEAGFFRKSDSSHVEKFLRDLAERAGADRDELDYLARLLMKAAALSESPNPRRRK